MSGSTPSVLLIAAFLAVAYGADNACKSSERGKCVCELADGSGKTIDLSTLVAETAKSPYEADGDSSFKYYYAFCNVLQVQQKACDGVASVCEYATSFISQLNLGTPDTTRFEMRTDNDQHKTPTVALVDDTEGYSEGKKRRSVAFLNCDPNKSAVKFDARGQSAEEDGYLLYYFDFTGSVFCPVSPSSSGGLSGGSILLIIFFCLVAVYFGGGFLFSTFVLKREGADRIPQAAFWVELPRMAKDGFFFTWNSAKMCCNRS